MCFKEKYLDVLQNIEFAIQAVYKVKKDLTDYDVLFAIDALIEFYTAEERKRESRDFSLSENSKEVYAGVKEMCEFRLGKENEEYEVIGRPISIIELLNCLKKIKNSVNKWTKRYGRRGYLDFVKDYV